MPKTISTRVELSRVTLKNLTEMAKTERKTVSDVINDMLTIPSKKKQPAEKQKNPLAGIIGIAHTGLGDAAQNHDIYLYQKSSPHK